MGRELIIEFPGNPPLNTMPKYKGELTRCKNCKHRPIIPDDGYDNGFDIDFPDNVCPCQCDGDHYYNWYPPDEWYCPKGE